MSYRSYFEGKKITIMGLGLLGRGVGVTRFLCEQGAELLVTDLKTEEKLEDSLKELESLSGITYVLGQHRLEDFRDCDMVIKAAGVPLDSPYIEEAKMHGIPVKMDASLFLEYAPPGVRSIGITGTRGKSTVTHALYHALRRIRENRMFKQGALGGDTFGRIFIGGNVKGHATLPLLDDVVSGDIVILELDSWQLQGFGDAHISPSIAIFTNFYEDHQNYYSSMKEYFEDKAHIFSHQKPGDYAVLGVQMTPFIKQYGYTYPQDYCVTDSDDIPELWEFKILGEHNRYNMACVKAVLEYLECTESEIQDALESFGGVEGRLELLREVHGVAIYNDNNATSPDAVIAGLNTLGGENNIVLIMGGTDKGVDMSRVIELIPRFCKSVILYPGSGTDTIRERLQSISTVRILEGIDLKECVEKAFNECVPGDTLLFSPAFSSFGNEYKNEYDRNDKFVALVKAL